MDRTPVGRGVFVLWKGAVGVFYSPSWLGKDKKDSALNYLQWSVCHKTKQNKFIKYFKTKEFLLTEKIAILETLGNTWFLFRNIQKNKSWEIWKLIKHSLIDNYFWLYQIEIKYRLNEFVWAKRFSIVVSVILKISIYSLENWIIIFWPI